MSCPRCLGSVRQMKNSPAGTTRNKRNAIKRSFEHTLSPAASKILKMEEQKSTSSSHVRFGNRKLL